MAARPWCFYYVQGEEGEAPEEPNAFQINGGGSGGAGVSLKQLLASFPLSRVPGQYHLRFKVKDPAFGFSWQDARDPDGPVPLWEDGAVHCKALRIDQRPVRPASRLRRKPMLLGRAGSGGGVGVDGGSMQRGGSVGSASGSGSSSSSQPTSMGGSSTSTARTTAPPPSSPAAADRPPTRQPSVGQSPSAGSGGVGRASSAPSTSQHRQQPPQPAPSAPTRTPSAGLMPASSSAAATASFFDTDAAAPAPAPAQQSRPPAQQQARPPQQAGEDLDSFLYGDRPAGSSPASSSSSSTPQRPATAAGAAGAGSTRGAVRAAGSPAPPTGGMAGLDIDGDDDGPGAAGTGAGRCGRASPVPASKPPASEEEAFFGQTATAEEIAAKKEEREQEAIRVKHGAKLEEWATDPMTKKPRNVRTLLSTMHTVLWDGCSWKAVSLGDLMMPDRVKFHYRKAMLVLHPDKNVNGSAEQRFIAEKVFTSVNEAYNVFSAQELK